ncbi:MAG: topoisomerase DNA-binding C4 zinc finger domain-containing protein, partial [Victivallales bacterium]
IDSDDFINEAFEAAGIPLLRVPVKRSYSTDELSEMIRKALSSPEVAVQTSPPAPVNPVCDKCGAEMVLRTSQKGANAGNRFWGCTNYPNCRNIIGEVR